MLVNMSEILKYAEEHKCAVGMFNATGFDSIQAIISAAEELNVPVILAHAEVHNIFNDISIVAPSMIAAAKNAKVPVCVHLDHGVSMNIIDRAIDLGFTSVMVDASDKSFDENVDMTRKVVKKAHAKNISVEAELGRMPTNEDGSIVFDRPENFYTNPDEAAIFVKKTGVDALAIAFGTTHGFYKSTPKLDFNVIKNCREKLDKLPLVMHGGSGVSEEDYRQAIKAGIRKINYYSYMSRAGYLKAKEVIESNTTMYLHDVNYAAMKAMKENVLTAMKIMYKSV
ncbi:MAG TPA: class II fructose-bisphosphate aldolase [Erysipelotrichaceae bacterium]|nr:class II fructose-bisphosphate aldolase [Erysipelotrichaceae bacterium]